MFYIFSLMEKFDGNCTSSLFCLKWISANCISHDFDKLLIAYRVIEKPPLREILSKIPNAEDPEEEPEEEEDKAPEEEDTEESDEEDEEARKYYAFLLESVRDRTESIICQTDVVMHETKVPLELRLKLKSSFDEALRIVRKKERN